MTSRVVPREELTRLLHALAECERGAVAACRLGVERAVVRDAPGPMRAILSDHERHAHSLARLLRDLRATPGGDAPRRGAAALADDALLAEVLASEDVARAAYEGAAAREDLPAYVREVICANLSDEQSHRAWLDVQVASSGRATRRQRP